MCGRARCTLARGEVRQLAGAQRWVNEDRYQPSYNAAPGAGTPVIVSNGEPEIHTMTWGLVPSYTKSDEKPNHFTMFNARSETVHERPAFRRLLPSRRCLVVMDGFYEWKKEKQAKQPYYIHLAGGEPLVTAGLWDVWQSAAGPVESYTILTTDSSPRLQWLHDRMPVLLRDAAAQQLWLNGQGGGLQKILVPYNGEDLIWYPVTPAMGNLSFQGPECCKELRKPSVASFFQPKPKKEAAGPQAGPKAEPKVETKTDPKAEAGAGAAAGQAGEAAGGPAGAGPGAGPAAGSVGAEGEEGMVVEEGSGAATAAAAAAAASAGTGVGAAQQAQQAQQDSGGGGPEPAAAVNADERPEDLGQAQREEQAGVQQAGLEEGGDGGQGARGPAEPSAPAESGERDGNGEGSDDEGAGSEEEEGQGAAAAGGSSRPGSAGGGPGHSTPRPPQQAQRGASSGQKRKAPAGGVAKSATPAKKRGGGSGKSPGGSAQKKQGRPPGQLEISKFCTRG